MIKQKSLIFTKGAKIIDKKAYIKKKYKNYKERP
jgi:hypothetical protein